MASGSTAAPSLFLRNATGLVKGWSGFDAFAYSFMWLRFLKCLKLAINQYPPKMILPIRKAMFISAPSFRQCWLRHSAKRIHPPTSRLTAYDFCNLRAARVSRLLWDPLISHINDSFPCTYPFVDGPTLEEWRSDRWSCGICSYVQMVSGNG